MAGHRSTENHEGSQHGVLRAQPPLAGQNRVPQGGLKLPTEDHAGDTLDQTDRRHIHAHINELTQAHANKAT